MSTLVWIIGFCLLGGFLSVSVAAIVLVMPERVRIQGVPHLISFAIGALLGAAFLALLPHALSDPHVDDVHTLLLVVLAGLLAFFILEKMVLWRHCHSEHCEAHTPEVVHEGKKHSTAAMILIGDGIHNLVDGVLIGAAFLTDIHLGVVTSIAVAAHEIPQEVGDFAILLHSGMKRSKALLMNLVSTLTAVVGGVVAYFSMASAQQALPYVLAVAAASFIYVAVADLIPGLHHRPQPRETFAQVILILMGVGMIHWAHSSLH